MLQQILDLLFNEKTLAVAVTALLGWVAKFVVGAVRRRNVAHVAFHAFHIVEDLAEDVTDGGKLDKALDWAKEVAKAADDYCKANGWRPLKPWEQQAVLLHAQSLSGQQIVALSGSPASPK